MSTALGAGAGSRAVAVESFIEVEDRMPGLKVALST